MCGIGGVLFHRSGREAPRVGQPAPSFVARGLGALRHRGPDGEGVFLDDGVALLHTRLALLDRASGQQPMITPEGRHVLVVNGEIYNHGWLRSRLAGQGAQFRTRSDSEALLWLLALHGAAGLADVEGEYAFCFWDRGTRTALLGRDPLGVKPLVWTEQTGAFWFASESKTLLALLPRHPGLNLEVVAETLVAPALAGGPRTPFHAIESVTPGQTLRVAAQGQRVVHKQTFSFASEPSHVEPEQLADALRAAVHDRLLADAPVGTFLSGGVDSSAIVAFARTAGAGALPCYTIRFDHHLEGGMAERPAGSIVVGDDAPFVEQLAAEWSLAPTRVHASRSLLLAELDGLAASQDRMVAWEQELSQRFLARAASSTVKAVLVGDAADETHFGYAFALHEEVSVSPLALLQRFGFALRRSLLQPSLYPHVDSLDAQYRALTAGAGFAYGASLEADRLATSTLVLQRWLPRLLHNGDVHTMAFGLEARVPFADRRVLQLAARVGIARGFRPFQGVPEKAWLRRALSPWLPAAIIARPKSALPRDDGLGPLFQQQLRTVLASASARARLEPYLALPALDALLEQSGSIDDQTRSCLFSILTFEAFLRHHAS